MRKILRSKSLSTCSIAAALGCVFLTSYADGAVIYRENFGYTGTGSANLTSVGWNSNLNATGSTASGNTQLSSVVGRPADAANVNAGVSLSDSQGLVFTLFNASTTYGLAWTNEFSIDRSSYDVTSISFYSGNGDTNDFYRIALQIGSSWYVTDSTYTQPTALSGSQFQTQAVNQNFTFTSSASSWRQLTFVPGTALAVGSVLTSDLPSGDITAFGLYYEYSGTKNTMRFDTFEIQVTPIPEPRAIVLLLTAGMSLVLRRRGGNLALTPL